MMSNKNSDENSVEENAPKETLAIEPAKENNDVIENTTEIVPVVIHERTERKKNKSIVGASTQMQLLHLAKQFALDGAIKTDESLAPIDERTRIREKLLSLRKQQNLESIIQKAIALCSDNEISNRSDPDWFNYFTTLAEDISNPTMQDLWAKMLAGEVSHPGSFSLKALKVFRNMGIHEAKLLAKAASLAVKDHNQKNIRIISGCYQKPGLLNIFDKNRVQFINLSNFGLNHTDLLNLADNNLLFMQESESGLLVKFDELSFSYNGQAFNLAAKKADCVLKFFKFTPAGVELARLINNKPDSTYINYVKHQLKNHFIVS